MVTLLSKGLGPGNMQIHILKGHNGDKKLPIYLSNYLTIYDKYIFIYEQ